MPTIKILMYFNDHLPPHFHAIHNEYDVLIEIRSLKVYAGKLPKSQMKKVLDWAGSNQEFLMKKWTDFNPNS